MLFIEERSRFAHFFVVLKFCEDFCITIAQSILEGNMLAPKPGHSLEQWAEAELEGIRRQGRVRQPVATRVLEGVLVERDGRELVNFSSNDYLGLSQHPDVIGVACDTLEREGAGAGASRMVTGNSQHYEVLEALLASCKGAEAARVFGSGYLANIGVVASLVGKHDLIVADKLVHACILDGARLSGAELVRFRHNDMGHLRGILERQRRQYRRCLIVSDAIFSMDGDAAPIEVLGQLKKEFDCWLLLDEAHALGVCPEVEEAVHNMADVRTGTLSKAVGSYGGYVCGSQSVVDVLTSAARSLLFSTALPPATVAASCKALEIMRDSKEICQIPLGYAKDFTQWLGLPEAESPIVPIIVGGSRTAMFASRALEDAGVLLAAIRPPTVPEGTARLRVTFSALHTKEQVQNLAFLIHSQPWFKEVRS
jgi:8-amino-7-oxononanoate synthase